MKTTRDLRWMWLGSVLFLAAACESSGGGVVLDSDGKDGAADTDTGTDTGPSQPSDSPPEPENTETVDPDKLDSDNDGLSDKYETDNGLDPKNADSDGDGVSDLAEIVADTNPLDKASNPQQSGDFYFLVPYQEDPAPVMDTLVFSTNIQKADLFILMDTTGSMQPSITKLRQSLKTVIIPETAKIIPDVWFGVGRFDDYPVGGYGTPPDKVFELLQRTTSDSTAAQAGVNLLKLHNGVDGPESDVPALWATATGSGLGSYLAEATHCAADEIGYPCFRSGAVPIVLLVTDAPMHNGPGDSEPYEDIDPIPPTWDEMTSALAAIHARVLSIKVGVEPTLKTQMQALATATGTVDESGAPLVFQAKADGSGLDTNIVEAISVLASQVSMRISAVLRDDPDDDVDATGFVESILPNTAGGVADPVDSTKICAGGLPTMDLDSDGVDDAFSAVTPGTPVCFDIHVRRNETVPGEATPTVYKAYLEIMGDETTVLDTREIFFLVLPTAPVVF